jgi:hypothetical protein
MNADGRLTQLATEGASLARQAITLLPIIVQIEWVRGSEDAAALAQRGLAVGGVQSRSDESGTRARAKLSDRRQPRSMHLRLTCSRNR